MNEADGVAAEDGTADTDDDTSEGEENAQVEKNDCICLPCTGESQNVVGLW